MAMQFLSATQDSQGYHYQVWLDTTQSIDGKPDPAYVQSWNWSPAPKDWAGGETAYQQMTLTEVKLLAQDALTQIQQAQNPTPAPTPLSVNGATF